MSLRATGGDGTHRTGARRGFTFLPLVVLLVAAAGRTGRGGETEERGDVVNAVRCRVRCLSVMQRALDPELPHVYESVTLLTCLQEPECEACLRPCNQPFTSASLCEDACHLPKLDQPCRESCEFLEEVSTVRRPGLCPPSTPGDAAAGLLRRDQCVNQCTNDAGCEGSSKCCPSGCSWTCQQPRNQFDGTPSVPDRPLVRERPKAGSIELRWNSVTLNLTSDPVLYIVDSRWNIGRQESETDMTSWHQIAQTTTTSTVVSDITPGHWYQFRVTAVNINGRRGSSAPTKAFTLSKEPRRPGPPTNVTEGDTLIMGGRVAVNLHWLHPRKSDLPISRYKIFWSRRSKSGGSHASNEHRQVVTGDQMMFQIPNLEPDSTYFVQIQAICQYGEIRLKSDKVSLYIMTYPLPRSDTQVLGSRTVQPPNTSRSVPTPATPLEVHAQRPFYNNGVLKANITWRLPEPEVRVPEIDRIFVFWSPEACIADHLPDDGLAKVMSGSTQENFFIIYDLRFDCRYLLRVQSVTNQGVLGVTKHLTLATPSCHETPVVGHVKPDCPNTAVRLPEEAQNLQHSFFISQSNITARLSWESPRPDSSPPITGYRVIWGQMSVAHSSLPDASSTLTKVLPRDARSFAISGLHEGTTYAVRLQALSRAGAGRAVALHFTTPLLQIDPHRDRQFRSEGEKEAETEEDEDDDDDDLDAYNDAIDTHSEAIPPSDFGHQTSIRQGAPPHSSTAAAVPPSFYLVSFVAVLTLFASFPSCLSLVLVSSYVSKQRGVSIAVGKYSLEKA